jgi:3-isopropylmalate dehydrogenase
MNLSDTKPSKRFRIALLGGDGVGPEVVGEAVRALDAAARVVGGPRFDYETVSVGVAEYLRSGDPLPPAALEKIRGFDAVLLGAMGLPEIRWPSGVEMTPQIDLREELDLYCGLRPIYLYHPLDSPLRNRKAGDIDFLLIRENTEGLFAARKNPQGDGVTQAEDRMLITRRCSERIIRAAFEQSRLRRKHVTLVDKANVLPSMAFFRKIFDEIAGEYTDVATARIYVDAAALYLVRKPEMFDVFVTENMFGDILSDLAAALVGGMGMAPSADVSETRGVFQPSHGSAPDIAGKGIANPVATILSAAMMLDWLGTEETRAGSARIRKAVASIFENPGARTPDMGGKMTTREMGEAVAQEISN